LGGFPSPTTIINPDREDCRSITLRDKSIAFARIG